MEALSRVFLDVHKEVELRFDEERKCRTLTKVHQQDIM